MLLPASHQTSCYRPLRSQTARLRSAGKAQSVSAGLVRAVRPLNHRAFTFAWPGSASYKDFLRVQRSAAREGYALPGAKRTQKRLIGQSGLLNVVAILAFGGNHA